MKKLLKLFRLLRGLKGYRGQRRYVRHWRPRSRPHPYHPLSAGRSRIGDALRAVLGRRGH